MKKLLALLLFCLSLVGAKAQQPGCPLASITDYIQCVAATNCFYATNDLWAVVTNLAAQIPQPHWYSNNVTRTLNSAFKVSTNREVNVTYYVDIAPTISLTGGQQGQVIL